MIVDCHLPCRQGRRVHRTVGHRRAPRPISPRAQPNRIARTVSFRRFTRLRARQSRGRAHRGESPGRLIGFAFVNPKRDAGHVSGLWARRWRYGFAASKSTSTTAESPRSLRGRAQLRIAGALRRHGRGRHRRPHRARVPGRRLHHSASWELLGRFSRADLLIESSRACPMSTRTHRACAGSTCSRAPSSERGQRKSCSEATALASPGHRARGRSHALHLPPADERLLLGGNIPSLDGPRLEDTRAARLPLARRRQ